MFPMKNLNNTIHEFYVIEKLSARKNWVNNRNELTKLLVTISFVVVVMSVGKYDLDYLLAFLLYPATLFISMNLSVKKALIRMRYILPFIVLIGIVNPFIDKQVVVQIGVVPITTGFISMVTLLVKGILAIFASYLLIVSTSVEGICTALKSLHVPDVCIVQIQLTHRYIIVLLREVLRITQAYHLRAPKQKGIHYKAWGTLVGQLLLRSFRRSEDVYDSMCLRGFQRYRGTYQNNKWSIFDFLYGGGWICFFLIIRTYPLFSIIGRWILL